MFSKFFFEVRVLKFHCFEVLVWNFKEFFSTTLRIEKKTKKNKKTCDPILTMTMTTKDETFRSRLSEALKGEIETIEEVVRTEKTVLCKYRAEGLGAYGRLVRVNDVQDINFVRGGTSQTMQKQGFTVSLFSFMEYDEKTSTSKKVFFPIKYSDKDKVVLKGKDVEVRPAVKGVSLGMVRLNNVEMEVPETDHLQSGQLVTMSITKDFDFMDSLNINDVVEVRGITGQAALPKAIMKNKNGEEVPNPYQRISVFYSCGSINKVQDLDMTRFFRYMKQNDMLKTSTFDRLHPTLPMDYDQKHKMVVVENDKDFEVAEQKREATFLKTGCLVMPHALSTDKKNWVFEKSADKSKVAVATVTVTVKHVPLPINDQSLALIKNEKAAWIEMKFWQEALACFELFPGGRNKKLSEEDADTWAEFGPIIFSEFSFAADLYINEDSSRKYFDGINGSNPHSKFDRAYACNAQYILGDIGEFYLNKGVPISKETVYNRLKLPRTSNNNSGMSHKSGVTTAIINLSRKPKLAERIVEDPDYAFRALVNKEKINKDRIESTLVTDQKSLEAAGDEFIDFFLGKRPTKTAPMSLFNDYITNKPNVIYFAIYNPKNVDVQRQQHFTMLLERVMNGEKPERHKALASSAFPVEDIPFTEFESERPLLGFGTDHDPQSDTQPTETSHIDSSHEQQQQHQDAPVTEETQPTQTSSSSKKSLKRDSSSVSSSSSTSSNKKTKVKQ